MKVVRFWVKLKFKRIYMFQLFALSKNTKDISIKFYKRMTHNAWNFSLISSI